MIIDCHGHYTPQSLDAFREQLIACASRDPRSGATHPTISDDQIRESIETGALKLQRERGTDLTMFSIRAAGMGDHAGAEYFSVEWARVCNELIRRVCTLYPGSFVGICQLPQFAGVAPANCIEELERCVRQYGFVGCNLNPDPSGGMWNGPPLGDRSWYPLYEKLVELDVPAMMHLSMSCNPHFHTTSTHYINGDTTAFMQFATSRVFKDFPSLKIVLPHGGGAVPYQWGRFRGLVQDMNLPPLSELVLQNIFFDTCLYDQAGIDLLTRVIPTENVLFGSEMAGVVRGIDPESGNHYDDTKRYVDSAPLSASDRQKIFEDNARRVYSRLAR